MTVLTCEQGVCVSATVQYLILFGLTVGTVGFVLSFYALARAIGRSRAEPGKEVPATAGSLSRDPQRRAKGRSSSFRASRAYGGRNI